MAPRLQTMEDFIKTLLVDTGNPDQPAEQVAHIRDKLIEYVTAITSDSELRLDPEADEIIHDAQRMAIVLKATYLTEIDAAFEKGDIDVAGGEPAFGNALENPDGYIGTKLKKAQRAKIRRFIKDALADGKVTAEEIVDFMVLQESLVTDTAVEARRSSMNGARLLLRNHGIEATAARLGVLARQTDLAAVPSEDEEEEKVAA